MIAASAPCSAAACGDDRDGRDGDVREPLGQVADLRLESLPLLLDLVLTGVREPTHAR